jgi:hypothetical protein
MLNSTHCLYPIFFCVCARGCSTRRIACTSFLCICAQRCSTRRMACKCALRGCARRCSNRRIARTCFFGSCARRCSPRRIACTCFFCGCAGTLRAPSQHFLLPLPRPLPPHAAPSVPCRLPRAKHAFSSPQPPLSPCLETLPACVWSISASCLCL